MKCTATNASFDWKGYVLAELTPAGMAACSRHLDGCAACRAEAESWQTTLGAMRALPQAGIPRHIVIAPQRVIAPARAAAVEASKASWWQWLWQPVPRLGFASAALLALAIVAHGFLMRPAATAGVSRQEIESKMQAAIERQAEIEVQRRLPQAVNAALDVRFQGEVRPALDQLKQQIGAGGRFDAAALEQRVDQRREADLKAIRFAYESLERRLNYSMLSSRNRGGD